MVVIRKNTPSFISVIPRYTITDLNALTLFLTDESTDERTQHFFGIESYANGILKINASGIATDTESGQTFKLEILNGVDFVYLGRLINVDLNTDIQNYSKANQSTSIFS